MQRPFIFSKTKFKLYFNNTPRMRFIDTRKHCGKISLKEINQNVTIKGWVHSKRKIGEDRFFLVLRDFTGKVQVKLDKIPNINLESVLEVTGKVIERPKDAINPEMPTGEIEIVDATVNILNQAKPLPLQLMDADEESLLRYRYLDFRRPQMFHNMKFRSEVLLAVRTFLTDQNFLEIETPTLFKSTPEGSREFLVPTRQTGKFYALSQSPQQYKQMLMVGGIEKYFQIAKCFRDETGRSDRQPEFTQIDLEMAFVTEEHVISLIENLLSIMWKKFLNIDISLPMKRMSYSECMRRFGSDKPDLRFDFEIQQLHCNDGSVIHYFIGKGMKPYYAEIRNDLRDLKNLRILKNYPLIPLADDELLFSIKMIPGLENTLLKDLGRARFQCGKYLKLSGFNFLWVQDFPLFEKDEDTGIISSCHHPFTAPKDLYSPNPQYPFDSASSEFDDDRKRKIKEDALKLKGLHYDIVLNGVEIGGGSIRIHNADLQKFILSEVLELGPKKTKERFSHLLDALSYGAPPHGGIALGFDRLLSMMLGTKSIRDVIAFPKSFQGNELLTGSPSEVDSSQLEELHLQVRKSS